MIKVVVNTQKEKEVIDVTDKINEEMGKQNLKEGVCRWKVSFRNLAKSNLNRI